MSCGVEIGRFGQKVARGRAAGGVKASGKGSHSQKFPRRGSSHVIFASRRVLLKFSLTRHFWHRTSAGPTPEVSSHVDVCSSGPHPTFFPHNPRSFQNRSLLRTPIYRSPWLLLLSLSEMLNSVSGSGSAALPNVIGRGNLDCVREQLVLASVGLVSHFRPRDMPR